MGLDVFRIAVDSFTTIFQNKTVLIFVLLGALLAGVISAILLAQISSLKSTLGPGILNSTASTLPAAALQTALAYLLAFLAAALIGIIIAFLIGIFITGGIISGAYANSKISFGAAASQSLSRYISLLGATILFSIIIIVGLILLILPGVYLFLRLAVAYPACGAGKKGAVDSLKNSWDLPDGNLLSMLAIFIILFLVVAIVGGIFNFIFTLANLQPVGSFISGFLGYSFVISEVLIYKNLSANKGAPMAKAKKTAK